MREEPRINVWHSSRDQDGCRGTFGTKVKADVNANRNAVGTNREAHLGVSDSGKEGKTNEQLWDMQCLLLRSKPSEIDRFVRLTDFKYYIAVGVLVNRSDDSFEAVA
jgi:hypothetical protein